MDSTTEGPFILVNNPDKSIGTATPAAVESIATATMISMPSQIEVSKPPKASGNKQSDCWQHYNKHLDMKPAKVECKHCKKRFSWGKDITGCYNSHGTTNMNNHIKKRKCPQFTPTEHQ
ncbi:hypothetical protein MKX03_017286 [Papaver bracteatum]|nr:hypothetical protein MKX03_017286 [Papaver bracteatum]